MKKRRRGNNFSRYPSHRKAMFKNMIKSLIRCEVITISVAKAKRVRVEMEKMITKAKSDKLHNRRLVMGQIHSWVLTKKLFENIAQRYSNRPGGYTRLVKMTPRYSDHAEMARIEFVEEKDFSGNEISKTDTPGGAADPVNVTTATEEQKTEN